MKMKRWEEKKEKPTEKQAEWWRGSNRERSVIHNPPLEILASEVMG